MSTEDNKWLAPKEALLPDFIISGAMKSGTTTLHTILNHHPDVFIPSGELHFFDMDNIVQHPDFNSFINENWRTHELEKSPATYWDWYASKFSNQTKSKILGEDSTTYLASESAIKRITQQNKSIKLVIVLRHPTARTYSHYWHMVKAGRAMFDFEDTLKFLPHSLLDRSAYLKQLKILYSYMPRQQVKVVLFEDFLSNKAKVIKDICDFIDIDFNKLPHHALDIHSNHARIPRFIKLDLLKTRMFRGMGNKSYSNHFSIKEAQKNRKTPIEFFERIYRLLNPLVRKKPEKINRNSKKFLDEYFYKELQGIDELLEQDVLAKWFKTD